MRVPTTTWSNRSHSQRCRPDCVLSFDEDSPARSACRWPTPWDAAWLWPRPRKYLTVAVAAAGLKFASLPRARAADRLPVSPARSPPRDVEAPALRAALTESPSAMRLPHCRRSRLGPWLRTERDCPRGLQQACRRGSPRGCGALLSGYFEARLHQNLAGHRYDPRSAVY